MPHSVLNNEHDCQIEQDLNRASCNPECSFVERRARHQYIPLCLDWVGGEYESKYTRDALRGNADHHNSRKHQVLAIDGEYTLVKQEHRNAG